MFERLVSLSADDTVVRGERADGSSRIIDQSDPEMYAMYLNGAFGASEPYQEPKGPQTRPDPAFALFRLSMAAARAVLNGVENPSDDEITEILEAEFHGQK
ncbi:MAG: hypothetical protein AAGF56_13040 [Pseudomonadota bacterium]